MNKLALILSIILAMFLQTDDSFTSARSKMVKTQIKARGIRDPLTINALLRVPRHKFVPVRQVARAYHDTPLQIGYGQTISQPYLVAYMTQIIKPEKDFKVLEIGTGSGYQASILAEIVDSVYTIEIIKPLETAAKKRLNDMGYNNIIIKHADGYYGWEEKGPFDAIVVTAAAEYIPPPLINQLKEGGRMIIPVGTPFMVQQLLLVQKKNGKTRTRNLMFVRFVPFTRSE